MNCKIGDIAVIIRGPDFGKLVAVKAESLSFGHPFWFVESLGGLLKAEPFPPQVAGHIEDERLKPLRDTPGEDETLRILELETL